MGRQLPFLVATSALFLASCTQRANNTATPLPAAEDRAIANGTPLKLPTPLGLPPVDIPAGNPITVEAVALGNRLFFDPRLSDDNTISCASCHNPRAAFADPRRFSEGVGGKIGNRNAPPAVNAAFVTLQFWDGRATGLEAQAAGPIANPVEMNLPHEACASRIDSDTTYKAQFEKVFGPGPVTMTRITKAIASYERTLLSGDSPFDRYQFGGDKKALSPAAIRGLAIFKDPKRGNCATCHTIEKNYALLSDGKFHNIGVGLDAQGELSDLGRFAVTKNDSDKGAFRTPSLRNVALTAPYMHDGSQKTLKDVIDFYVGGGSSNPNLDKEIKELKLSGRDRADLIAFMESLTGKNTDGYGN